MIVIPSILNFKYIIQNHKLSIQKNMNQIALEGMRFYAYHGFYDEEQIIGTDYVVDVYIKTNFGKAAEEDDLFKTINYETVHLICQREMKIKTRLLETIAARILEGLKYQFQTIQEVTIRIKKANPIPGVDNSIITLTQKFISECGRCGNPMVCYKDEHCWCQEIKIHPQTQSVLEQKYGDCLCKGCLNFYAG